MPATVPGCVHTDLLAAGLIADPFLVETSPSCSGSGAPPGATSTTFRLAAATAGERVDLVFEGLDTIATVSSTASWSVDANQHRSYRFDVRDLLSTGTTS